ncbi:ABC transporter ATP-binding protein [Intestinibacter sp.]
MKEPILKVKNLGISFSQYTKGLVRSNLNVIKNLDIELNEGEILAVVGSSGSGKSLLAHAILGILPDNSSTEGSIIYKGEELTEERKQKLRGDEIVLIPQSVNYLDPLKRVGNQIKISIKNKDKKVQDEIVDNLFEKYNLDKKVKKYYPFQLSGGMARKVLLCTALASNSKVIIADEPTPGLDEESLNEVLMDFRKVADSGCAILMITHDISAALKIADKVAIFYAGSTLEIANTKDFVNNKQELRHPYTKALYSALPEHEFKAMDDRTQPLPNELPSGCVFCDRCHIKSKECEEEVPEIREIRNGKVRCIHAT